MKDVLIIGSGISGLTAAITAAEGGARAILCSPCVSERAQSVMAAGGINASTQTGDDTVASHVEDTLRGGRDLGGRQAVEGLCARAPELLSWLESLGTVFTRDETGGIARRAFGGQSHDRTAFAGACTGKQIVTALVGRARELESEGRILRRTGLRFCSALISGGRCTGAVFFVGDTDRTETVCAHATVMAVGGQNRIFGKTTGSMLCDGAAVGQLFLQGVTVKNPEFVQYHPTTIETPQKRMLISEAARGEGGRLFYLDGEQRVYFMEDRFGPRGNLMPRDVVSKCIYNCKKQVYLDISFLGREHIRSRLQEVEELAARYLSLDVCRESIPVAPSVHFFMGGLAVDRNHRTDLPGLYAVGECASMYHGANRLGGNSLLAAVYSGRVAGEDILNRPENTPPCGIELDNTEICIPAGKDRTCTPERFLAPLAEIMQENMGITRTESGLRLGISRVDELIAQCRQTSFSSDVPAYERFRVEPMLTLARAMLTCGEARRETRGAHMREDHPETRAEFARASLVRYDGGAYTVSYAGEDELCW